MTQPFHVVLLGPPASGKGSLCSYMPEAQFIYPGKIYRKIREEDTEQGRIVRQALENGGLIPDDITNKIIQGCNDRLRGHPLVVVDGYPRTLGQLDYLCKRFEVGTFVVLEADLDTVKSRILGRRHCDACGLIFNTSEKEFCCDPVKVSTRFDDAPEMVDKRWNTYLELTAPVAQEVKRNHEHILLNTTMNSSQEALRDLATTLKKRFL